MSNENKKPQKSGNEKNKSDFSCDHDVMLLHSPSDDGEGVRALRFRPGRLDFTELHPVADGQAVGDNELIKLTPKKEAPYLCDVNVLYTPHENQSLPSTAHAGPARVSSRAYRQNWDRVFGSTRAQTRKKQLLH